MHYFTRSGSFYQYNNWLLSSTRCLSYQYSSFTTNWPHPRSISYIIEQAYSNWQNSLLSQHLESFITYFDAIKCVIQYLIGTKHLQLVFRDSLFTFTEYSDVD